VKGHFNYVNHVTGLHVDGKVLNSQLVAPNTVRFPGERGAGCTFTVTVQDNGEPGTLDTFGLTVTGTKNEVRSLRVISRVHSGLVARRFNALYTTSRTCTKI
jgi:hypothetical protein